MLVARTRRFNQLNLNLFHVWVTLQQDFFSIILDRLIFISVTSVPYSAGIAGGIAEYTRTANSYEQETSPLLKSPCSCLGL